MNVDFSGQSVKFIKDFLKANLEEVLEHDEDYVMYLKEDSRKSVQELADFLLKESARREAEISRVTALYNFDMKYGKIVCGVDEVGRGPLAGPIVGAAVVLKPGSDLENLILGINDSKKLSKAKREELDVMIREKALSYAIHEMSNLDIDRLGISYCNHEIFRGAIRNLSVKPELVLSDGYKVKDYEGANLALIKGDSLSASIACASIIAKVHRDRLMEKLDAFYPEYGFKSNVGYGSKDHIDAIRRLGPTPLHRMSFITNFI
ncbi:MAG: ribonuclease HII [Clostridiaceae bacterium]